VLLKVSAENYTEQVVADTLEKNYMPYAMSVIVSRALPEIDGFKPSHRKLLYTMYKMGLLSGERTKSANVVGQTMKLNPHGEMAIYETLVRLTRGNGSLLHPFVDSKGNFGKVYSRDMQYAASRYTEVRLDPICAEIFCDLDKNTVEFVDNYDGTMKEPVLLPTTYPNILVNVNQGIAVGMASNICSFNLEEVCRATIEYMNNPDHDISSTLKAPDFSTGGQLIYNKSALAQIYKTGRGSFRLRAKYRYDKKNSCIEIYELPYTTTCEAVIEAIIEIVKSGKIREITDVRDETDLNGLKVTIDIRKSADPDEIMNKLYKLTPLQDTFNCNFNVLIDGRPKVLGIKGILDEWIRFRIGCIKRQTQFDIDKKSENLHLLLGLQRILLDIDKAIAIIRGSEHDKDVIPNLMKGFDIDKEQAEFIAEIRLRNLNKEYILNRVSEIESLEKEIRHLKKVYESDELIKKIIKKQLEDVIKKYGQPRRTEIIHEDEVEEISTEQLIQDYNLKLFLTRQGYLKKIPLVSLRASSEHRLKDGDEIIQEAETRNKADLLLFSNRATVYKLKIYELEDNKASDFGEYLQNILDMEQDERIIYIVPTDDYSGNMVFAFDNGKVSKIVLKSYETNRRKLTNAYNNTARLVFTAFITEDTELVAISSLDKVLIFDTQAIAPKTTRTAQGVQVMKAKKDSRMVTVKLLSQAGIKNPEYYRTKNIPAVGKYLRNEDIEDNQIKLEV